MSLSNILGFIAWISLGFSGTYYIKKHNKQEFTLGHAIVGSAIGPFMIVFMPITLVAYDFNYCLMNCRVK